MLACCDWHMQLKTTHLNGWPGTGLRDFLFSLWHTGTGHGKDKMAIPSVISRRNHYPGYAGCYMLTCTSRLIWTLQGAVNDRQSKHLDYRADTLAVKKYKCNLCWCTSLWGPHKKMCHFLIGQCNAVWWHLMKFRYIKLWKLLTYIISFE